MKHQRQIKIKTKNVTHVLSNKINYGSHAGLTEERSLQQKSRLLLTSKTSTKLNNYCRSTLKSMNSARNDTAI